MSPKTESRYVYSLLLLLIFLVCCIVINVRAEVIGEVKAKGLFIKDHIEIIAFDDPTIKGVACYTTRYVRPFSLMSDSTNSSLACRRIGKVEGDLISKENVFSQDKAYFALYKETVVDRFYDKKRNVLVYISYTKSWGDKNTQHSVSVVPLGE